MLITQGHDWSYQENKRKRTRSDSVLWRKPVYQQKTRQPIDNTKTPPNTSITQRFRPTVSWSTTVINLVWLNWVKTNLPTHHKRSVFNRAWHDRHSVYNTNIFSQRFIRVKTNQKKHFYKTWIYLKLLELKYFENKHIEYGNAHSNIRQLRHRLRTANCTGNRQ